MNESDLLAKGWVHGPNGWYRTSKRKADSSGLRASDTKPTQGSALDSGVSGEKESDCRFAIVFTIYAVRPADWDGYCVKQIQDALVEAGLLRSDAWDRLEGVVRSCKVHTKGEEKTVVEIVPL